ncbi:glycosyltransferase family 2 protein [Leisingera sp. SS27]|uniref:glycosyltransferase family 2 protein n=1 Tax=Leisingera sp. SS27 TaxID=2979462 RepID=UPI00232F525A|nr:glycosyltransferase family 2 protein [Leisingera sp. SS27]MDC0660438.1 glycosyltransferase family 2 protein [Leisingera sp. SS27]
MTRISAIITAYNVEPFIATAMQSVADAGFEDLELIVVDDGSRDATRQIADAIGAAAPADRVAYVPVFFAQNTIGGVACAANAGLERATGDIVVFVDGDDWVLPHNLAAAVQKLQQTEADFIVCGCKEYWNSSGNYTRYPEAHLWDRVRGTGDLEARRELLLQMAPFPWRKIYRRRFLEQQGIRFPVGDYFFEDNPFHWETSVRAASFCFFEPVTHVHRMEREGQTVASMGLKPLQIFEHAATIRAMLAQTGQAAALEARYFHWLADHVLWCGRHVPPEGLNRLFSLASEALEAFPDALFWERLAEKPRGMAEVQQLTAVKLGDRMGFLGGVQAMLQERALARLAPQEEDG